MTIFIKLNGGTWFLGVNFRFHSRLTGKDESWKMFRIQNPSRIRSLLYNQLFLSKDGPRHGLGSWGAPPSDLDHVPGLRQLAVPLDDLAVLAAGDDVARLVDEQGEHGALVGVGDRVGHGGAAWRRDKNIKCRPI